MIIQVSFWTSLSTACGCTASEAMLRTPPYEDLQDYFPEIATPNYAATLREFFQDLPQDGNWYLLRQGNPGSLQYKDEYATRLRSAAEFVANLLEAFGYGPVCNICPGQDSRAGYVQHTCGAAHFKFVTEKFARERGQGGQVAEAFWQSWKFVLGEVMINYLTGELRVQRIKSYIGIQVRRAEDLPTIGGLALKRSTHDRHFLRISKKIIRMAHAFHGYGMKWFILHLFMSMSLQERDYVRNAKFSIRYSTLFSDFIVHDTPAKASPASNKMPPQESHLPTLLGDVFCVLFCVQLMFVLFWE